MGRLLTLFHWRVGFSSNQCPVLGKHLILGPVSYIFVVLEGQTRGRNSYFLPIINNWPHSVRRGAWASQLDRSSWGSSVSCSLTVQLAHVTSPTPLLSSAAPSVEQIIIPTSGLCRDGVKACVEALGQAWIGPGPTPCFLPQHHSIKENAQTLETAGKLWLWQEDKNEMLPLMGREELTESVRNIWNFLEETYLINKRSFGPRG